MKVALHSDARAYVAGMKRASEVRPIDSRDIRLGVALGYRYLGAQIEGRPLREYVLPKDPFHRVGPFVIVTELILDDRGYETGRRRILRWMPRRKVTS